METVHRLEEDEFFDLEDFTSRGEFLAKVHTFQLYFNIARPNSHKQNQSPWQIIERLAPRSPLELCLLPPVFLDYYLNDLQGYDVGRLPYARQLPIYSPGFCFQAYLLAYCSVPRKCTDTYGASPTTQLS